MIDNLELFIQRSLILIFCIVYDFSITNLFVSGLWRFSLFNFELLPWCFLFILFLDIIRLHCIISILLFELFSLIVVLLNFRYSCLKNASGSINKGERVWLVQTLLSHSACDGPKYVYKWVYNGRNFVDVC